MRSGTFGGILKKPLTTPFASATGSVAGLDCEPGVTAMLSKLAPTTVSCAPKPLMLNFTDTGRIIWSVLRALLTTWPRPFLGAPLQLGAFLGAVAGFLALAAFLWSWLIVPRDAEIEAKLYFEVLFWGGGHTLQFQHALLMAVALGGSGEPVGVSPRLHAM